jgi:hypothetical protein
MTNSLQNVDHSALKINQVTIIVLNILAFILNQPWVILGIALVMIAGTILGKPGFLFVYNRILKPLGWAKPKVVQDNPEPHRFSQGLGGALMLAASVSLFMGGSILGWGLVWLVTALAALNAFGGFCVGCFAYYWLARFNIPGFTKFPPEGSFPGMRPKEMEANEF